jgi:hypothetical protein
VVELSLQRGHVGGPFPSGWALVDQPPSLLQPGVDLIQVMENNGFRRSRSPQCPSIDLAVVADNEVMQHVLDFDGKSCHSGQVSLVGRMDYLVDTKVLLRTLAVATPSGRSHVFPRCRRTPGKTAGLRNRALRYNSPYGKRTIHRRSKAVGLLE